MRYLIDTQIFVWSLSAPGRIRPPIAALIDDGQNELFLSIASLWEISIKMALGKLLIKGDYPSILNDVRNNALQILPITFAHTVIQHRLPFHHRDPFDRILAAQALGDGLDLVSSDAIFDQYFAGQAVRRWF